MRLVVAALMSMLVRTECAKAATDLPPVGRSLFDHLTIVERGGRSVQQVPYPFEALLRALEARAGKDALGRPGVPAVLIPIGRSLQRNASPERPFDHPRIVAAVTGELRRADAARGAALKDRLFLGFQDEAGVLEIISYNEAAGRFEFQVVKDYRSGAEPQVFYASRTVCTACHHNAAPIFSRPGWDETNANPAVARALAARASGFHGVPVARGIDVPNAIDDAVARANRIPLVQFVWRDGCAGANAGADPIACRGAALAAALKMRLSASAGVDLDSPRARTTLVKPLAAAWRAQWPAGLAEPDANIPNRDPFLGEAQRVAPAAEMPWRADEVIPAIDPLTLRAPGALWQADANGIERFIRALASMFAAADVEALETSIQRSAARVPAARDRIELECGSTGAGVHQELRCAGATAGAASLQGSVRIDGGRATASISRLQIAALSLRDVALAPAGVEQRGAQRRAHLRVATRGASTRLADGRALDALDLVWQGPPGKGPVHATVVLRDELAPLERAIDAIADETRSGRADALASLPFRRAATVRALFAQLGIEEAPICCDGALALPAARIEHEERAVARSVPAALVPFYRHCGACHAAPDASPPGFLHGEHAAVERNIARCAARIDYRLAMWGVAPAARDKVTMPPPSFASSWEYAPPAADLAAMRGYLARLQDPQAKAEGDRAYERLPACRLGAMPSRPTNAGKANPSKEGVAR